MSRTIREITEELYPVCCGETYVPEDIAHEGISMSISWRMASAIHFCLLHMVHHASFVLWQEDLTSDQRRKWELWHELGMALIDRICKAKNPRLFEEVPFDESSIFQKDNKEHKAIEVERIKQ